jgi:gas vesicle protein
MTTIDVLTLVGGAIGGATPLVLALLEGLRARHKITHTELSAYRRELRDDSRRARRKLDALGRRCSRLESRTHFALEMMVVVGSRLLLLRDRLGDEQEVAHGVIEAIERDLETIRERLEEESARPIVEESQDIPESESAQGE